LRFVDVGAGGLRVPFAARIRPAFREPFILFVVSPSNHERHHGRIASIQLINLTLCAFEMHVACRIGGMRNSGASIVICCKSEHSGAPGCDSQSLEPGVTGSAQIWVAN